MEGSSAYVEQGRHWSSALIWLCAILFGGSLIWAFTAKLDQTITVRGRLEPSGSVRDVDSPSAGVVSKVHVGDGDVVKQGDPLFDVEAKGLASRRIALETTLQLLDLQARSLESILQSGGDPTRFKPLPALPSTTDPGLKSSLRQRVSRLRRSDHSEQIALRLVSQRQTLDLQQRMHDMKPLFDIGAMARNQYLMQMNQLQEIQAQVTTLEEERERVIGQAAAQLNQINRQMIDVKAQLVGLKETIIIAPSEHPLTVRYLMPKSPQTVVNADQEVLKLVPANRLQAKVEIDDGDIGFVGVGLPVNVSVDSFPSGEFGYIQGTLAKLGSDALPPDQDLRRIVFSYCIVEATVC